MIVNVKATNRNGNYLEFDDYYRIVNGFDVSGLSANVQYQDTNYSINRYQNTFLENRQLSIEVQLRKNFDNESMMDYRRSRMYQVFNPELNPIRFDFELTDGTKYYLIANATSTPVMGPGKDNYNAAFQRCLLQFICTDPYIYQENTSNSEFELASYDNGWEFDWEIPVDGYEFETRNLEASANLFYNGDISDGMTIRFVVSGTTINPSITNLTSGETMQFNITLENGDVLEVSTYRGERRITRIRDGVSINAFNALVLPQSTFMQLNPGDNLLTYSSQGAIENLDIFINYKIKKVGI